MIIAARSPAAKPELCNAAAKGSAASPNCRYVMRDFSRSRSASIRQTSSGQRASASRSAAPSDSYFVKSSIKIATEARSQREKQDYMGNSQNESLYSAQRLESRLDPIGECTEVADALDLVIREFDAEMIFQAREEFEGLQAVNSEFLVEIIARLKPSSRNFEVSRSQSQDFVSRLFNCFHNSFILQEYCAARLSAACHGKYGCALVSSTNLRRLSITAGREKGSQKISISRRNSSVRSGLMNCFAAAAVV